MNETDFEGIKRFVEDRHKKELKRYRAVITALVVVLVVLLVSAMIVAIIIQRNFKPH